MGNPEEMVYEKGTCNFTSHTNDGDKCIDGVEMGITRVWRH
jgi:hypothetical protein